MCSSMPDWLPFAHFLVELPQPLFFFSSSSFLRCTIHYQPQKLNSWDFSPFFLSTFFLYLPVVRAAFLFFMLPRNVHCSAHRVFVEDFMVKDVKMLTLSSTYMEISQILRQNSFRSFPLVTSRGRLLKPAAAFFPF